MRTLTVVVAVCLIASPVYANAHKRHAKMHYRQERSDVSQKPTYPERGGWYERDANKLPFGSAIWWEQMQREGRLGGEAP
jgi:hypothetical protein